MTWPRTFRPRGAIRHLVGALGLDEEEWSGTIKLLPRWGGCDQLKEKLRDQISTDVDVPYLTLVDDLARIQDQKR